MKKILTASLVAMMAVTAANADIASTKYVNTQSGLPESQKTFVAGDFKGVAADKTNLKDAVNAIADSISDGTAFGADSIDGSALKDGTVAKAKLDAGVQASLDKADNALQSTDLAEYAKTVDVVTNEEMTTFQGQNTQAIADAKSEAIADAGTAADGKIQTALADYTNTTDMNSAIATAKGEAVTAAGTAADGKIQTALADYTNTTDMNSAIATAKGEAVTAAGTAADTKIQTALADYTNTTDMNSAIATAKSEAIADAQGKIEALDVEDAAVAGEYVSAVSEANGKISVTRASLTAVAKMNVPTECENGTATCALVYDNVTKDLKWESIVK